MSTKLELPDPPSQSMRRPWPLRSTDVDRHGHVNNAAYWQAVEHVAAESGFELRKPLRALLDFREPVDLGDELELTEHWDGPDPAARVLRRRHRPRRRARRARAGVRTTSSRSAPAQRVGRSAANGSVIASRGVAEAEAPRPAGRPRGPTARRSPGRLDHGRGARSTRFRFVAETSWPSAAA